MKAVQKKEWKLRGRRIWETGRFKARSERVGVMDE